MSIIDSKRAESIARVLPQCVKDEIKEQQPIWKKELLEKEKPEVKKKKTIQPQIDNLFKSIKNNESQQKPESEKKIEKKERFK